MNQIWIIHSHLYEIVASQPHQSKVRGVMIYIADIIASVASG